MSEKSIPTYKSQHFTGVFKKQKDGNIKFVLNFPLYYQRYLNLRCENGDVGHVYLTNKKPLRSESQNNYYWLYLDLVSLSSGHTVKGLHKYFTGLFLGDGTEEIYGADVTLVKSTSGLNRVSFSMYMCFIEDETGIESPTTEPFLKPLTHKEYDALKEEQREAYLRMKPKIFMK